MVVIRELFNRPPALSDGGQHEKHLKLSLRMNNDARSPTADVPSARPRTNLKEWPSNPNTGYSYWFRWSGVIKYECQTLTQSGKD